MVLPMSIAAPTMRSTKPGHTATTASPRTATVAARSMFENAWCTCCSTGRVRCVTGICMRVRSSFTTRSVIDSASPSTDGGSSM